MRRFLFLMIGHNLTEIPTERRIMWKYASAVVLLVAIAISYYYFEVRSQPAIEGLNFKPIIVKKIVNQVIWVSSGTSSG